MTPTAEQQTQLNTRQHFHVVPDFFSQAGPMRACIDEHFDKPFAKSGPSQMIWDYWYVPNLYTYMRTEPRNIITGRLMDMFKDELQHWAMENLGLGKLSNPYISLYVNGCGQGLHNDAKNGRWAFVYSLTNWERRKFTGGETIVFRDENYWETDKIKDRAAGSSFYQLVPSSFNQLVIFDDRVIHGVQPLQGTMDPREGRFVIHGHIRESGIQVLGELSNEDVEPIYQAFLSDVLSRIEREGNHYHGMMTLRLWLNESGMVQSSQVLMDRILRTSPTGMTPEEITGMIMGLAQGLTFPEADTASRITFPVVINHPL